MRYEDASGSFQASGPNANDDSDTLSAGSRQAATGNLITGEGTQYGAAGADSAAGGHITSIAGKGGEDSSFAGGKLGVTGEHGSLSVDAEGNYNYIANKGAPENVRDRFIYTLADNQGNSDTAALVIELGKTPVVIKADAQQVVPGPDGVVTLPPGVELSDVMVVGRNLVINMPDGTQLIIVDGAIFVPQLVLDGVQAPATNVAALLIGQEPQPAAGELPPSSGGNFALPPPPLDPGVPLGDLIPPTVRDYTPPEPQEVFDTIDDDEPLIDFGNIDILIDDDTLPAGLAGGAGDGPDAVNVTGFLASNQNLGGNPPYTFSLQLTTAPEGFAVVSGGPGVALLQQNGVTVRTISFNEATGQYEITQNAPILHPPGGEENDLVFVVTVTATDADGDTATGTITITYDDDTPGATDAQVGGTVDEDGVPGGIADGPGDVPGVVTVVNGSVASLFLSGADGPLTYGLSSNTSGLPSLTSHGVAVTYVVAGDTLTASAGGNPVFTLEVNTDGSYTFTLLDQLDHATLDGQAGDDTENDLSLALGSIIQATDIDGDPVTAPANGLVIVVDDDTPANGQGSELASVDEDELPDGITDGDGEDTTASGSLAALAGAIGADQPGSFGWDASALGGLPALTSNGAAVHYAIVGDTLVAYTGGDANNAANHVFTVELEANGDYTVTLLAQVDHLPNVPANDDDQNLTIDLSGLVVIEDADGDAIHLGPRQFLLDIEDDIPVAVVEPNPVTGQVDEDLLADGNNDSADGDDAGGTTDSGGAGSLLTLFNIGADQPGKIVLLSDTSDLPDLTSNGVPVTYAVVGDTLTASAGGNDVFTLTVNEDGSWEFELLDQLDHPVADTEDNLLLDFSSIIGAEDADGDTSDPLPNGSFVIDVDDDLPVPVSEGSVTGQVDEDLLADGNNDSADGDDAGGTTDSGGAGSLLTLFNIGADQPGKIVLLSDTSDLPDLTSNGVPVTYAVVGDTLTASAGGNDVFTLTVNEDGSWEFELLDQLDHPVADTEDNLLLDFSSIIGAEDADGDTSDPLPNGSFVIDVDDDLPVPVSEGSVTGQVDEDLLADGNNDSADGDDAGGTTDSGGAGSLLTLFNIGADQPGKIVLLSDTSDLPDLTSNGVPVTYAVVGDTLTASAGGNDVFTLTVNADGSWEFELLDQLDHPEADTEDNLLLDFSSIIGAEDADGDTSDPLPNGSFVIDVDDDLPVPVSEGSVTGQVDEDLLADGNNDSADGDDAGGTTDSGGAGSLLTLFNIGADQPGKIVLLSDTSDLPDLTSNGVPVTYAVVGDTLTASAGGNDVFTLTVNADGSWEFELLDQLDHPVADTEDNLLLDFSSIIGAEDADGDTSDPLPNGSFVIDVDDDMPVAANDTDTVGAPGTSATGNVITDNSVGDQGDSDNGADSVGADLPGSITNVVSNNEPGNTDQDADPDVFEIQGEFGLLVMNADGSYTYTRDLGSPGGGQDVFTYTLTDADGDSVTATLTIAIADAVPVAGTEAATVDDDGLANANPAGTNDINANLGETPATNPNEAIFNGTLNATGGDAPLTYSLVEPADGAAVGQETVNYSLVGNLLTATIATSPDAGRVGDTLFTVELVDASTGDYVVTLVDNVLHGDDANNDEDGIEVQVTLPYQVEDSDGSTSVANGQLTISFNDDVPTAAVSVAGLSISHDETPGVDGDADDDALAHTEFVGVLLPGNDPDVTPNPIGFATSTGAVSAGSTVYGADGGTSVFSLAVSAAGVDFGLNVTGGQSIELFKEGNLIVGRVDGGTFDGQAAFAIAIDPTTGVITMVQYLSIQHTNTASFDESASIANGAILAVNTVTDADGDVSTASTPIGNLISFQDDGPDSEVDAQVDVPTVTLDETRPEGNDDDSGDSDPAGDESVTVGFASNFETAEHGADGPGAISYQLVLSADGEGSGLFALDNTDTDDGGDGDGYGQGDELLLFSEADGSVTGRTTDGGPVYFTISVNAAGEVTFTQSLNVWHADTSDDDDLSGLSAAGDTLLLQQTVTDGDGDSDSSSIDLSDGVFFIEDDGPEIHAVDNILDIDNDATPSGIGDFDFDIGTDSPNGGSGDQNPDDISLSNFAVAVNGIALDPADFELVQGPEDATTANYTFSFDYDTGNGGIATAEGTLVFNKSDGTYEVELTTGPIAGFSIVSTATGEEPVFYNDEHIGIVEVADGLFMQFTGYSSATGPNPFGNDDVFGGTSDNVHISSTEIGVHGNALQDSEVVDFEFMTSDPGGVDAPPSATASTAFIQLGQFNSSNPEDVVVVLKLADPNDPDNFITRTIVVEGTDILDNQADIPAGFPILGTNEAMIIVEPGDYINLPGVPDNYEIAGMQIRPSTEGLPSAAGEVYNFDGDVGEADNTATNFTGTSDNDVLKIVNIGAVVELTENQSATISFDVTIHDADGDSQTESITVNIGDTSETLSTLAATSELSDTSSFSLLASDSQAEQLQKTAANSNTLTLATAVAAAGFVEPVAAHDNGNHNGHGQNSDQASFAAPEVVERYSASDGGDAAVSMLAPEASTEASAPADSSSSSSSDNSSASNSLDDSAAQAAPESNDAPAADDGGANSSADAVGPVAPTVAMVSAEALEAAANDNGNAQQGGSVEQIVADALHQGDASDLDAVLANLPGGNGGLQAIAHLASPDVAAVSGWHMGGHGAIGAGFDMMFKMDVSMHHQDAVQPVANG